MQRRQLILGALAAITTTLQYHRFGAAQTPAANSDWDGLSFNEVVYLGVAATWIDMFEASRVAFVETSEDFDEDSLDDQVWINETLTIASTWISLDRDVRDVDAPNVFEDASELFQDAFSDFASGAEYLIEGLGRGGSASDIERAADYITSGLDLLTEAQDAMPYDLPLRSRLDRE